MSNEPHVMYNSLFRTTSTTVAVAKLSPCGLFFLLMLPPQVGAAKRNVLSVNKSGKKKVKTNGEKIIFMSLNQPPTFPSLILRQ